MKRRIITNNKARVAPTKKEPPKAYGEADLKAHVKAQQGRPPAIPQVVNAYPVISSLGPQGKQGHVGPVGDIPFTSNHKTYMQKFTEAYESKLAEEMDALYKQMAGAVFGLPIQPAVVDSVTEAKKKEMQEEAYKKLKEALTKGKAFSAAMMGVQVFVDPHLNAGKAVVIKDDFFKKLIYQESLPMWGQSKMIQAAKVLTQDDLGGPIAQ